MSDMIRFEDMDKDNRLGLNEFYAAFSKLYSKCTYACIVYTIYLFYSYVSVYVLNRDSQSTHTKMRRSKVNDI